MKTHIFIQARMSSSRFPGKILAPLRGKPVLKHVIDNVTQVKNASKVIVLTSNAQSDDPVVAYLKSINCLYFRGSLDNVFDRFQSALHAFPCEYFVRVSADSPLLQADLVEFMIQKLNGNDYDIISNVVVRTFPKGQSIEIAKSKIFMSVDKSLLSSEELEHVFPFFYRNQLNYKICSIKNTGDESSLNYCVDTLQDLQRLSAMNSIFQYCGESIC